MAFFAILIALVLEQVRPLTPDNALSAQLRGWLRALVRNVDAGGARHGWLAWALAVVMPALAVAGVNWLAGWLAGWPLQLLCSVAVLYLTLGFRQFSHHFTAIRDALEADDDERARTLLARWQQLDAATLARGEIARLVIEYSVLAAHRHVFGVLPWFCLTMVLGLGPSGAVLYRCAGFVSSYWRRKAQAADQPVSPALSQTAAQAWRVLDWLPARATALALAIVGSFEDAIQVWSQHAARFADSNDGVVLAATAGAIGVRLGGGALKPAAPAAVDASGLAAAMSAQPLPGEPPRPAHFAQVIGLLWRMVALWLLLLALLTLARVIG